MKRFSLTCFVSLLCLLGSSMPTAAVPRKDIVETAAAVGTFQTLAKALQLAGLVDTLRGPGPFTVFAPTDDAFSKLPPGTLDAMLKPQNHKKLVEVLTYHMVPGRVLAHDFVQAHDARTVNGKEVRIVAQNGRVIVEGASVVRTTIECSNGVIHVIDSVLLPQ